MSNLRSRTLRTPAIVLRQTEFAEADRVLTLYTRALGKLRAVAKGVRRITSRKAGHLEQFQTTDVLLARGRDLYVVTQAEVLNAHRAIREDLQRMSYASYCMELLDQFTVEDDEAHPALYDLAAQALTWLDESHNLGVTTRYYELRLLDLVGYRPELEVCVVSGQVVQPEDQFFSVVDGGVVRPGMVAAGGNAGMIPLSLAALKVLRYLQRSAYAAVAGLTLSAPVASEVETIMQRYLGAILERQPRSMAFIRQVRRTGQGLTDEE